jgi:periplasmic divalent cation tolerance protein
MKRINKMTDYCIVLTTAGSETEANKITDALLSSHSAACVQQMPISSAYHWNGKIEKSSEILMLCKTRTDLYDGVAAIIAANHSYDVPEIIRLPIDSGLPAYFDWISKETK